MVSVVSDRNDLLLIARGLAALSVLIWHSGGHLGQYPFWLNVPGRTAVWLFFGISGYVIAYGFIHSRYSLSAASIKDFYVNRLLRIYPLFLLLSFIAWVTEFISSGVNPISIFDIPAQLFAIQFNHDYLLNGVFWTLGVEIHFYLLAPMLLVPFLQKNRLFYFWGPILFYILIITWIIFSYIYLGWSLDGRNIVSCLPHFLTGIMGCRLVASWQKSSRRFLISLLGAFVLSVGTNYLYHYMPKYYWTPIGTIIVDVAILLLIIAHASWAGSRSLLISSLAKIGLLSYGIYASHGYWMRAIPELFMDSIVLLFPVSIFCAQISYLAIETPALRLKRVRIATT